MSAHPFDSASDASTTHNVPQENEQTYGDIDAGNTLTSRPLEGEELTRALVEQLEHVFSREYLASDPFLVSRLSADFFAPISIIEELPIIKSLTTDTKLVNSALRASKLIVVDESKQAARPAARLVQRNTIIVRDVPENTTEQDVRNLFQNTKFDSAVQEVKAEVGNTFFIRFANEEVTLDAYSHLRQQTLGGKAVQARIKSENLLKSLYYTTNTSNNSNNFSQPLQQSSQQPSVQQPQPAPYYTTNGTRGYSGPPRGSRGFGKGPSGYGKGRRNGPGGGRHGSKKGGGGGGHGRSNAVPVAASHWPPLSTDQDGSNAGANQPQQTDAPTSSSTSPASSSPQLPADNTTTTTTASTSSTSTDQPAELTGDKSGEQTPSSTSGPVTAWAVSNSAVKQPPAKRAPTTNSNNASPTISNNNSANNSNTNNSNSPNNSNSNKKNKQKSQTQTPPNNATGGAAGPNIGGKWKENNKKRKGGKHFNKQQQQQQQQSQQQQHQNRNNGSASPSTSANVTNPTNNATNTNNATSTNSNTATNTVTNNASNTNSNNSAASSNATSVGTTTPSSPATPHNVSDVKAGDGATVGANAAGNSGDQAASSGSPSSRPISYAGIVRATASPLSTTPNSD